MVALFLGFSKGTFILFSIVVELTQVSKSRDSLTLVRARKMWLQKND